MIRNSCRMKRSITFAISACDVAIDDEPRIGKGVDAAVAAAPDEAVEEGRALDLEQPAERTAQPLRAMPALNQQRQDPRLRRRVADLGPDFRPIEEKRGQQVAGDLSYEGLLRLLAADEGGRQPVILVDDQAVELDDLEPMMIEHPDLPVAAVQPANQDAPEVEGLHPGQLVIFLA